MASIKQLENKIKIFQDFSKVVNIQKIVIMKEVVELKKIINKLYFRDILFSNLLIDLNKGNGAFEKDFFSDKKSRVPVRRDLHFIMATGDGNTIDKYADKLIIQHIKKNHKPADKYVIIGKSLGKQLKKQELDIVNIMTINTKDEVATYERIAKQVLRGYKDLMFVRVTFIFFDLATKQIIETKLIPFADKKKDVSKKDIADLTLENKIMMDININKTTWLRDLDLVSHKIASLAIKEKTYYLITEYKLASKLREMQALDDKEKNILEEISAIRLKMQRVRQESVTNELLTNAVAFGAINVEEEEEDE